MARPDPDAVGQAFLEAMGLVETSRLKRLWSTGRSAAGLARSMLSRRAEPTEADLKSLMRLTERLGELKGLAMKAGQVLSFVDAAMPAESRAMLALLQTKAPASPFDRVEATLRAALGPRAGPLLEGLERVPVAVASIGQVHRARLADGTQVAVKVRHAGIEEALKGDFATAQAGIGVAKLMMPFVAESGLEAIGELRTAVLEECDFELEGRRQQAFGALFVNDPVIVVPSVLEELTARTVLTTRWKPGTSFERFVSGGPSQAQRDAIGAALFRFYIGALYRAGQFHADPHPGNYAVAEDGRLVVYDFGCVRSFADETVLGLARLVEALRADDAPRLREAGQQLGFRSSLAGEDFAVFRRFARGFFGPVLAQGPNVIPADGSFDMRQLSKDKLALARLGMPGKLLFLARIRFGVYAVLARLGARVDWGELERGWAAEVQQRHGEAAPGVGRVS
jgi:predicted unusual protein kinase regulating ubiquinone biosynthesis (AarF/ABC1/UbiB family)